MTDTFSRAKKLFELGGQLGHRKSRLHPRSRKFVYQIVDGVSIIDLEQTIGQIDTAKKVLTSFAQNGKILLICSTKKAVADKAEELAKDANAHYVVSKWLPGLLTNFNTITKNVKKLNELKRQSEVGEWAKFVKHEQIGLEKEVRKLGRLYGGITTLHKLPDIMLVVDIKREKNAVNEAHKSGIPVIAIVDTNCNPDDVDYPIMLNDDTPAAVEEVLSEIISTYKKNFVDQTPKVKPVEVVTPAKEEDKLEKVVIEAKVEPKIPEKVEEIKKAPAKKKVVVKKAKKAKV